MLAWIWYAKNDILLPKIVLTYTLWQKIVLVIKKNFWNSKLKAENLQNFLEQFIQTVKGQNNFW